jgi:hypothetical protein
MTMNYIFPLYQVNKPKTTTRYQLNHSSGSRRGGVSGTQLKFWPEIKLMVAGRTGIILHVVGLEVVLEHGIVAITQDTNRWTGRPIHPENSGFSGCPETVAWRQ